MQSDLVQISVQYWLKGGILLLPIAAVCFLIWFYFLKLNYRITVGLNAPDDLEYRLHGMIARGETWSVISRDAAEISPFLGRILGYITANSRGNDPRVLFDDVTREETGSVQRDLTVLRALVAAAPLLGLIGTVLGMMDTFSVISSEARMSTAPLASGISKALITTQFGLVVALPGIFAVNSLKQKSRQLSIRLSSFEHYLADGLRKRNETN